MMLFTSIAKNVCHGRIRDLNFSGCKVLLNNKKVWIAGMVVSIGSTKKEDCFNNDVSE